MKVRAAAVAVAVAVAVYQSIGRWLEVWSPFDVLKDTDWWNSVALESLPKDPRVRVLLLPYHRVPICSVD